MSAIKERLKEEARRAAEQERTEKPTVERPPEVLASVKLVNPSTALEAILRNAEAAPEALGAMRMKIVPASEGLEADGCEFLEMGYLLLDRLECPPKVRDFVMAVCALSRGNYKDPLIMTNDQIAELLGYEKHAIKEKREAFIAWQQQINRAVIDVVENERDRSTRHFLPTQYRARFVFFIAEFIRRVRAAGVSRPALAARDEADKAQWQIADGVTDEMDDAPMVSRRKASRGPAPKPRQKTFAPSKREKVTNDILNLLGDALMAGENPVLVWKRIEQDVAERLGEMLAGYPQYTE